MTPPMSMSTGPTTTLESGSVAETLVAATAVTVTMATTNKTALQRPSSLANHSVISVKKNRRS